MCKHGTGNAQASSLQICKRCRTKNVQTNSVPMFATHTHARAEDAEDLDETDFQRAGKTHQCHVARVVSHSDVIMLGS